MPCLTYRALDYNFLSTYRTAFESGKLGHLSNKYAGGFMVWRRTLLMPVAVMYCISVLIDIYVVVNTYRVQPAVFVRDFVGEMLWNTVFCPHKPCKAVRGLEPIHTVLLCTDATLAAVGLFAAYKMAQGARHWATYRLSSRHLRVAFAALFVAPFALFLALPPAQFIQVDFVQSTLCEEKMKSLAKGLPPQALPPVLWEFCREDISAWEAAFNQSLVDQGRLRNPRTGTCPAAVTVTLAGRAAFAASGKACIDNDAAFANLALESCAQAAELGLCTSVNTQWRAAITGACPASCQLCFAVQCEDQNSAFDEAATAGLTALTSCADALAAGACTSSNARVRAAIRDVCPVTCGVAVCGGAAACLDRDFKIALLQGTESTCAEAKASGMCVDSGAAANTYVRTNCPETCELCPGASGRRQLQSGGGGGGGGSSAQLVAQTIAAFEADESNLIDLDGCVSPIVVQTVGALQVALSDEVIVGAFALRRGSTVLLTLLPAALGLSLGAGQGMTLAKAVLPSSRLPSRLAGLIVSVSLPTVAALLAFLNQLLASAWGTLSCVCVLAALSVWMPLGVVGTLQRSLRRHLLTSEAAVLKTSKSSGDKHNDAIINPSPDDVSLVVSAIGRRKWMLTLYLLLAIVFLGLFFGLSSSVSMITEQLAELQDTLKQVSRHVSVTGNVLPVVSLVAQSVSALLRVLSMTYMAQVFYSDTALVLITTIWHHDRNDADETKAAREDELVAVATALGLDRDSGSPPAAASV